MNATITLEEVTCPSCYMVFAVQDRFIADRRKDGGSFRCPSGHSLSYRDDENTRLKKELEAEKQRAQSLRLKAIASEEQLAAALAEKEKLKKKQKREQERIKNGVCPCCNRNFQNLHRHIKTKHPGYSK